MSELFLNVGDVVVVDPSTACDAVLATLDTTVTYSVRGTLGMLITLDTGHTCHAWNFTRLETNQ